MTEPLLATETNQPTDAGATQGGAAVVDKQPAADQQTQTETEKPGEPETEKPGEPETESKREGAPDRYEEFSMPEELPEGFKADQGMLDAFADVARELDLPQVEAQKIVSKVLPVMQQRTEAAQIALHEQWLATTKGDKEIGGDKLDENLAIAKRAIKAHASEGLQELLNGPLGSHPEVVRFLVNVGRTVSEDKFVGGGARGHEDPDSDAALANKLYPSQAAK